MPKLTDPSTQTEISEIFSSIQGEGPYLGSRQIFVRFGRCNMHCVYCDELEKMKEEKFSVYELSGLVDAVSALEKRHGEHHSISLTGGEPLFYTPFLRELLPELKKRAWRVYLETNGTLPQKLSEIIRWCDIIAMDLKPASSTGDRDFMREHEEFLRIGTRKEIFAKIVVTPATALEDIRRCAELVSRADPNIPFIFQPQTDAFGINAKALELIQTCFFELAQTLLRDVRMIPQMHKIWGVR